MCEGYVNVVRRPVNCQGVNRMCSGQCSVRIVVDIPVVVVVSVGWVPAAKRRCSVVGQVSCVCRTVVVVYHGPQLMGGGGTWGGGGGPLCPTVSLVRVDPGGTVVAGATHAVPSARTVSVHYISYHHVGVM